MNCVNQQPRGFSPFAGLLAIIAVGMMLLAGCGTASNTSSLKTGQPALPDTRSAQMTQDSHPIDSVAQSPTAETEVTNLPSPAIPAASTEPATRSISSAAAKAAAAAKAKAEAAAKAIAEAAAKAKAKAEAAAKAVAEAAAKAAAEAAAKAAAEAAAKAKAAAAAKAAADAAAKAKAAAAAKAAADAAAKAKADAAAKAKPASSQAPTVTKSVTVPDASSNIYTGNGFPHSYTDNGVYHAWNCTWWADQCAYVNHWNMDFRTAGDAASWYDNVKNATQSATPAVGSIMVLSSTSDGTHTTGHVGYVYQVDDSTHFWISHANYSSSGAPEKSKCTIYPGSKLQIDDGSSRWNLRGFLVQK